MDKFVTHTGVGVPLRASNVYRLLEQAEPGLNCLALPLRRQGRVVAALGVAGPVQRLPKAKLRRLAQAGLRDLFGMLKL